MPTTTVTSKIPPAKTFPKSEKLIVYRRPEPSSEQAHKFCDKRTANVFAKRLAASEIKENYSVSGQSA